MPINKDNQKVDYNALFARTPDTNNDMAHFIAENAKMQPSKDVIKKETEEVIALHKHKSRGKQHREPEDPYIEARRKQFLKNSPEENQKLKKFLGDHELEKLRANNRSSTPPSTSSSESESSRSDNNTPRHRR